MKFIKNIFKALLFIIALLLITTLFFFFSNLFAQNINITFNLSNTEQTLKLLNKKSLSKLDIDSFLSLKTTQALIKKTESNDSLIVSALSKALKGEPLSEKEQVFQYDKILEELNLIENFYAELKPNIDKYQKELNESLGNYASPHQELSVEIVGILGGNSTGYTFGDWDKFYISIHHMKGDSDYLISIFKHELFHNLQAFRFDGSAIRDRLEGKGENRFNEMFSTYLLLEALYNEGTATYLDNWLGKKETEANKGFFERSMKSKRNKEYIFYLFDRLIPTLSKNSTQKDINSIYNVFFTTRFNEAGYYIGSLITDYLLQKSGNELTYYMDRGPIFFIEKYLELSKDDEKAPYIFSTDFYAQVEKLSIKIESINR